jgi:hypothetical protein
VTDLDITRTVTISATGATSPTVKGGASWTDRIFYIITGSVTIKGIVIREGQAGTTADGGGVRIGFSESIAFVNVQVANSTARNGGGIYNSGTLMLDNTSLISNTATSASLGGGGIVNGGTLTLSNSTFISNTGHDGGAIYNNDIVTLTNATLIGNIAANYGGGIYNSSGTATLSNATFISNTASIGGGIDIASGTFTLTNSTFTGNAGSFGAAAFPTAAFSQQRW